MRRRAFLARLGTLAAGLAGGLITPSSPDDKGRTPQAGPTATYSNLILADNPVGYYELAEPYGLSGIVDTGPAQQTFNRIQGSRLDAWR